MVKSKFPGKPSKFTNRKLVNVSNCTISSIQENESQRAAEFICYGLSVFNETFGADDDEPAPFHGFSPFDIARSKELTRTRIAEIENEYKSRGAAFLPLDKKVQNKSLLLPESFIKSESDLKKQSTNSTFKCQSISVKKKSIKTTSSAFNKTSLEFSSDNGSSVSVTSSNLTSHGGLKNLFTNPNSNSGSGSKNVNRNYLSSSFSSANNSQDKSIIGASNHNAFRKNFVLPCRSAHSARVIKPNKRFLDKDHDGLRGSYSSASSCSSSVTSSYDSSEQIINEPIKEPPPSTSCSSGIQLKKPRLVLGPVHDDPNFTWARSRDDSSTIISDVESDDASSLKTISSSSSSTSSSERPVIVNRTRKTKKLILRKPRLNIDTPPLQEPTRPKSGAIRGKIVCGVCNATRFYAFVRQARKFGIYSCESCRKFISKSIHTIDRSSVFHCSGGKGQCTVPPVLRTVIWDVKKQMINKGKKMRCKACWLKMCIRCYCMPEFLKIRLNKLLPSYMRDPVLSAKKIKKTADNKCKRRSHSIDSVKSTAKDNVEQNIKSKSLRQIRFEDRAKRKNAYVRRIRQRRNSLYGSNTMKSETNEESSVKNEDNESDVSGANKSSDDQNDDVDTAKESINKSSRGITVRKRRCKFKEKPGRRNKFKININNRKFRNHRRRRKNCSELSSSSNDSDTNEDFKKDDAQNALQKRIKIKQEQTQQELEMVSIVKSGTMKVNTSVNCFSVNKLKEESDKQLLNCKFEAAAVTRDYEVEKKILSLLSVPKSDVTNLETVDVPLVVPKKRGRRKKIPGEVKPPAETAAPVVKEEIRQKRKAALNSLANIARVTGRITESTVENQLIVARNLKKRATAIARREPVVPFQRKNDVKEIPVGVKRKRKDKIIFSNAPSVSRGSSNRSSSLVSLQGPRVKHVCRSASLVLGKQVATFNQSPVKSKTLAKETLSTEVVKSSLVPSDTSSATAEAALEQQPCTAIKSDASVSSLPIQPSGSSLPQPPSPVLSAANVGGGRIRQPSLDVVSYKDRIDRDEVISGGKGKSKIIARTLQDLGKLNCEILDGVSGRTENISVSMDFWESYDPDEVAKTGFALIGSDTSFRVPSLCFLCGSAGVEKLIHCACCCEPYHLYCLNGGMKEIKEQSQWWRVDWVCPRCAVCNACGKGDGNRVSCNRCCKSYHIDCLPKDRISNKAHSSDRPWVCHSCLKCKSCYAKSVSKFVGNIPLCNSCFKLRQKGSFCPLCQKCYDDNDFDTKMMECGRCKSWVHAKCEGLSNEKYQVLSFLPDSVEFICRLCCDTPPAPWWLAVEAELRAGYLNVLKTLTKNRKTCELLKWSPKKQSLSGCTCNNLSPSNRNNILITTQPSLPRLDLSENFEQEQEVSSNVINPLLKDRPTTKMKGENLSNDSTCSSSCASFSLSLIKVDECLKKNSPVMQFTSSMNLNLLNENFKPNESNLVNADSVHSDSKDNKIINDSINDGDDLNVDVKSEIKTKFKLLKECSVALKDCLPNSESSASTPPSEELQVKINDSDQQLLSIPSYQNLESNKGAQFSPHATSQSDSGIGSTDDELKPSSSVDDSEIMIPSNSIVSSEGASSVSTLSSKPCCCLGFESLSKSYPSLLNIKNKVNSNSYSSLEEFHKDMQHVIDSVHDERLLQAYYQILFDVFPWFDPKCPQVFDSNDKDIESLHVEENDKTNIDKKDFEVDSHESPEYYEDASVVLKGLLGLSRSYYYYNVNYKDPRVCVLCKLVGDGLPEEEGRLLYCGHNEWVHANCALWSNEVFEEIDGSLQHVHGAISRSRLIRCVFCGKRGASVGCCYRNCPESYHYPCAREGCCVFMEDKSIYCNLHQNESKSKPLSKNSDFEITRPIYVELVELEKKKKKFIPHHQVKVMVGSLSVESLGEFIPDVSDQELSIVPCEFVCTRLYWSTVEPWRLVQYHIKTKILQSSHVYFVENEENFTVDHSLDVQKDKISDDVGCYNVKSEDIVEPLSETDASEKSEDSSEALESINAEVKLVVNSLLDNVSIVLSREEEKVEETLGVLTDAQTSADLLPPEIKDAIFEDLPHDILDGISMQDIFPKLMSYDDVIDKNDKLDSNSDNNAVEIPNNCNINSSIKYKKIKCGNNDQSYFSGVLFKKPTDSNSKLQINNNVNKSDTQSSGDMMKSSPSKLILKSSVTNLKPEAVVKTDINLRTVNKFDYNGSKDTENENLKSSSDWKSSAILQVDGATDYSSGDSDVGSPHNIVDSDDKILCKPVLHVTIQDTKIDSANKFRNKEKLELCQIIQVDGCVDSGSEYESGNDTPKLGKDCEDDSYYFDYEQNNWRCISQLDGTSDCNNIEMSTQDAEEEPVKCMRCHRTYRTAVSYERHLSTCNADYILSCSESDSSEEEKSSSPLNGPLNSPSSVSNSESPNNHSESTESANNLSEPIESSSSSTVSAESTGTIDSSNVGNGEMSETNEVSTSLVELNSDFCQGAEDVVEYVVQTSESTDGVQESTCINSALYKDADSPGVNPDNNSYAIITSNDEQNEIEIPNGDVTVYYTPDNIDNCILINIDNDNKIVEDNSSGTTYYVTDNAGTTTGNSSSVIGTDHLKNAHILGGRNKEIINYSHTAAPIHTPQQTQQQQIVDYQGTPTLIIQQIPSQQNVMPTYVETFSQPTPSVQSQQNVHYITIDSGDKTTPQYSSVLSNAYQIQSPAPAVQTVVPTVVGTIIQPNGVEQLLLNTNPTNSMDVFGQQGAGGVYLSSPPPMYMNMETVVSNTVMSSSQFVSVPGSVPGMLSTYSATTTQVFQAAKPVIDIPSQSYLVINTSPNATATAAIVDNSNHHMNATPQATITQLHQAKQEQDQWPTFRYQHQQNPVDRPHKVNDKTTVVRQILQKDKTLNCVHQVMNSTENRSYHEPVRVTNCNKRTSSDDSDVLKIMQNAQKIGPVHHLSKLVDNIQTGSSATKKICLNSIPVKQNLPEVLLQQKINPTVQKLDSFADKFNKKVLYNTFNLPKKSSNLCYNNKLVAEDGNKKVHDSFCARNVVNNFESSPDTLVSNFEKLSSNKIAVNFEKSLPNNLMEKSPSSKSISSFEKASPNKSFDSMNSCVKSNDICTKTVSPPVQKSYLSKEADDKFDKLILSPDHRKVIVESVKTLMKDSDKAANDYTIRTYSKKKGTILVPSTFVPQMKELKSQLTKEYNKHNQKYINNNLLSDVGVDACANVGINSSGATCTNVSSNVTNISVGNNNRVLQPTLKENKILDKMKLNFNEKCINLNNNIKRSKHSDKKVAESTSSSNKKDLMKERPDKIVNGRDGKKIEKMKRKEISSSVGEDKPKKLNNTSNSLSSNNNIKVTSKKSASSPNMVFEINSEDGFSCSTPNLVDAWQKVFEAVQAARASKKLPPLPRNPYQSVNSLLKMLGLGNNSLKYMIEQLPGVSKSVNYKPTYHKNRHHSSRRECETKENLSGCARTEPFSTRNKYDMFSWLASRHRRPPKLLISSDADIINGNRRATSLNLPMAMRFRHLRETSKEAVGVFRSDIHGRGLFCLRDIDSGEMVIEYAGEVIRSALTDTREKYYTSKGIGCYMFRIDDNFVVDATMKGNAARFINHSCEPNCYSRVVDILGKKHILIFALRRIPQGEELTYDYKFPLEDDKITCHCLSRKCRKYLN